MEEIQGEIRVSRTVFDLIKCVQKHTDELVDGSELGFFMFGEITFEDNKVTAKIDDWHMPKQKVSGVEVDIEEEGLIEMCNEVGDEKMSRLVAHGHSHPFDSGVPEWSSVDEKKIEDFMDPVKQREVFAWILTGKNYAYGRIEINMKATIMGKEVTIKKSIDKIPINVDEEENKEVLHTLKTEVEKKVTVQKFQSTQARMYDYYGGYYNNYYGWSRDEQAIPIEQEEVNLYECKQHGDSVLVYLDPEFYKFLASCKYTPDEIMDFSKSKSMKDDRVRLTYKTKSESVNYLTNWLERELAILQEDYINAVEDAAEIGVPIEQYPY